MPSGTHCGKTRTCWKSLWGEEECFHNMMHVIIRYKEYVTPLFLCRMAVVTITTELRHSKVVLREVHANGRKPLLLF